MTEQRDRPEQAFGVGVRRVGEQRLDAGPLDDATGVHDLHAVGDPSDHAEVVRDHHDRHAHLRAEIVDHLEDLRLNGHIEGGCRLVGDQHLRVVGDGHGDHHTLAHTAREFVRILFGPLLGLRNSDGTEQVDGTGGCRLLRDVLVGSDHFDDLITDTPDRVERRQRILEDHRHPLTADRSHRLGGGADEFGVLDLGRTGDLSGFRQETEHPKECHGLS